VYFAEYVGEGKATVSGERVLEESLLAG
jgi:hypothetical protein